MTTQVLSDNTKYYQLDNPTAMYRQATVFSQEILWHCRARRTAGSAAYVVGLHFAQPTMISHDPVMVIGLYRIEEHTQQASFFLAFQVPDRGAEL